LSGNVAALPDDARFDPLTAPYLPRPLRRIRVPASPTYPAHHKKEAQSVTAMLVGSSALFQHESGCRLRDIL